MNAELRPNTKVCCPHCGTTVQLLYADVRPPGSPHAYSNLDRIQVDGAAPAVLFFSKCPACSKVIVQMAQGDKRWLILPRVGMRRPIHPSVPKELRADYDEAVLVLNDSPKASAALARRCLQSLLVLNGAKKKELVDQLAEIEPTLPHYVKSYVDNIRKLGNVSAHAKQSRATGEIVEVEAGEADWMLEVLEELFDHYYAKPAEAQARQAALNEKLADAGKLTPPSTTP